MVEKVKQEQEKFLHIVRIANVDVPGEKQVRIAMNKIKGVGINFADIVCKLANVNRQKKAGYLTAEEVEKLTDVVVNPQNHGIPTWIFNRRKDYETGEDKHVISGSLNFTKENDLKRLKKIKCLKGMRHQRKLPVRGQRTRSNFRRTKGKVVGVKRKGKK